MTKTRRVINVLEGIVILAFGGMLMAYPKGAQAVVLGLIGLGMTIRGIRALVYYFSMARHMVGGKSVLYRGIIFLDVGLLTSSLGDAPEMTVILYIAVMSAFAGVISIMRARESKAVGSPKWKGSMLGGAANIIMAIAVIVCGFVLNMPEAAVYVYGAGLIGSAVGKIASAFKRTAIVYIQ